MSINKSLKKLLTIFLGLSIFNVGFLFAKSLPLVNFSLGLSTGHVFYGLDIFSPPSTTDESSTTTKESEISYPMKLKGGNEILAGISAAANFNVTSQLTLYGDIDVLSDFSWLGKDYSNHLDYSLSTGIKLSLVPNVPALSVSIGYLLGSRVDFYKKTTGTSTQNPESFSYVNNNPWGNGIKIGIEYNFYRDNPKPFMPTLGCCWRHIPRGKNVSDNIINAYVQINL